MAKSNSSSTQWKEERRFRAWALDQENWKQRTIAKALGVTEAAVSQWLHTARENGFEALRARPHPGAPPRLTRDQLWLIPEFLSHGAEAYGFRGEVWTCPRIAKVIEYEFGVSYDPAHVSRLLKQLDWTPQKPIVRASQRNETLIEQWRTETWPDLKKMARDEQRTLVFVDESGFYLLPGVVRTYAPRGQAPELRVFETRDHLSVMSCITAPGDLFTLIRWDPMTGCESVTFLKHLRYHLGPKLLVIWDGSPIHRSREVKQFLAEGAARDIHLEALPPYAPDLNPDEGVWQHLKHVELRNKCCTDLNDLHHELYLAIRRVWNRPDLIRACFSGAGLDLGKT